MVFYQVFNAFFRQQSSVQAIQTMHRSLLVSYGWEIINIMWRWDIFQSCTGFFNGSLQILFSPDSQSDLVDYSSILPFQCTDGLCPLSSFIQYANLYIPNGDQVSQRGNDFNFFFIVSGLCNAINYFNVLRVILISFMNFNIIIMLNSFQRLYGPLQYIDDWLEIKRIGEFSMPIYSLFMGFNTHSYSCKRVQLYLHNEARRICFLKYISWRIFTLLKSSHIIRIAVALEENRLPFFQCSYKIQWKSLVRQLKRTGSNNRRLRLQFMDLFFLLSFISLISLRSFIASLQEQDQLLRGYKGKRKGGRHHPFHSTMKTILILSLFVLAVFAQVRYLNSHFAFRFLLIITLLTLSNALALLEWWYPNLIN